MLDAENFFEKDVVCVVERNFMHIPRRTSWKDVDNNNFSRPYKNAKVSAPTSIPVLEFSFDVLLIAPVKARRALYWTDSIFFIKWVIKSLIEQNMKFWMGLNENFTYVD